MDMAALSAELLRVVNSAEEILRRVDGDESSRRILAGGWARKPMGHLIDSASNNHQRFVRASLQDSLEFPTYDQNGWSRAQAADEAEWSLLVALWANYNRYLAHVIARLPSGKLAVPHSNWPKRTRDPQIPGGRLLAPHGSSPRPNWRGADERLESHSVRTL